MDWWHSTMVSMGTWTRKWGWVKQLKCDCRLVFLSLLYTWPRPLRWLLPAVNKWQTQCSPSSLLKQETILPLPRFNAAGMLVAVPVFTLHRFSPSYFLWLLQKKLDWPLPEKSTSVRWMPSQWTLLSSLLWRSFSTAFDINDYLQPLFSATLAELLSVSSFLSLWPLVVSFAGSSSSDHPINL